MRRGGGLTTCPKGFIGGGLGSCVPRSTLEDGLIHYWAMDGNCLDSANPAGNGTPVGITYAAGVVGQCGVFGGSSRVVTAATGPVGDSPRTYAMWVYPTAAADEGFFKHGSTAGTTAMLTRYAAGQVVFSNAVTPRCSVMANINEWTFIAFTYDGSSGRMYRNGDAPVVQAFSAGSEGSTITLGSFYVPALGYDWTGSLDEVLVYDRALMASEVAALFNTGTGMRP